MKQHTHIVCAAFALAFMASVAYGQSAPAEGGAKPAAAPKAAQPKPAAPTKPAATTTQPTKPPAAAAKPATAAVPSVAGSVTPPPGYLIGADDILSIVFWKDKEMTTDVQVRPDGKI